MTETKISKEHVLIKYIYDDMSKFKNPGDLRDFLDTLDKAKIPILCNWLSAWRKNGVYQFIVGGPSNWNVADVHISKILVGKINDKVNHLLEKNEFLLESIGRDTDICEHNEFASQGDFELKTLVAQKSGELFTLKDGIHRAIRATCDGQEVFRLLYYEH